MIFSFPLNKEAWNNGLLTIDWLKNHRSLIHDVYTTLDILECAEMNGSKTTANIKDILTLKKNNISVNIIINNVFNPPNMDLVLKRLTPLKDIIDSVTVPNHKWIQPFKDLGFHVKSTVIHVPTIDDISNGLYDSYDTIYIHDEIIHNHDKWLNVKGNRRLGCLVNLGYCKTDCPVKRDHYMYIDQGIDVDQFCPTFIEDGCETDEHILSRCIIPPFLEEYEYYLDTIDEYKFCGRDCDESFQDAFEIIDNIHHNNPVLLKRYSHLYALCEWRKHVRNCGGQCSKCKWCHAYAKRYIK